MPEWTAESRQELSQRRIGKDPVEQALLHLEQKLTDAWTGNRCLTCPIGELAALAAATRTFYQERNKTWK
jgi:hypothetical protein